jgi:hypothetical protein
LRDFSFFDTIDFTARSPSGKASVFDTDIRRFESCPGKSFFPARPSRPGACSPSSLIATSRYFSRSPLEARGLQPLVADRDFTPAVLHACCSGPGACRRSSLIATSPYISRSPLGARGLQPLVAGYDLTPFLTLAALGSKGWLVPAQVQASFGLILLQ